MDSLHTIDLYDIATLEDKIFYLEKAIGRLEEANGNQKAIANLSDQQLANKDEQMDILKKQLKKEKRKKFIVGAVGIVLVVLLIL